MKIEIKKNSIYMFKEKNNEKELKEFENIWNKFPTASKGKIVENDIVVKFQVFGIKDLVSGEDTPNSLEKEAVEEIKKLVE